MDQIRGNDAYRREVAFPGGITLSLLGGRTSIMPEINIKHLFYGTKLHCRLIKLHLRHLRH
jgi:hypothetical protein